VEDAEGASSAGQYESFLNVRGEENLINSVKKCWASLYTARVMYYRNRNSQPQNTSIGVAVMRMVNSDSSGVAFTVDPTNPQEGIQQDSHRGLLGSWRASCRKGAAR
jgi:pyruvate,water dikinase